MSSPPTTLGKYQIIREIARSNDIVYEAYDPLMNRRVALKELAVPGGSTQVQKDERLKRFLREAKAAGSLAHPNIVTIYEVGEEGGRHYLVMEYLDGHTLRNELDTHGFLAPDKAVEVGEAILRGLDYAHQNGVIHRDIKPENIQLLTDGRIKLTDFGIARLTFEPNLTMDGQVFGTPSYMSPEQVVGRDIDARSDLFSVGVVLYEMFAGQKPFAGDSVVAITYAIMNKEPSQPQQANHAMWQVISRALDKSPALRYANSPEMLQALKNAANASRSVVLDPQIQPIQTQSPGYFASPQPPQQGQPYPNPYSGPQPPIQYPYNPYNPYAPQPQQGSPFNPPLGQPIYDPAAAYQPSPFPQQPNLPIQAYYPPPPRQPLLKQEHKAFLGRVVLVAVLLGTLFLLLVEGLMYYNKVWGPSAQKNISNQVAASELNGGSQPVAQEEKPNNNDPQADQEASLNGLSGDMFRTQAEQHRDEPLVASGLWDRAADRYQAALDRNSDPQYGEQAADALYRSAVNLEQAGDKMSARDRLYKARKIGASNTDLSGKINQELDKLR